MTPARMAAAILLLAVAPLQAGCEGGHTVASAGSVATTPSDTPSGTAPRKQAGSPSASFWSSFSAPLWVVLVLNAATLLAAGASAWAALRTNPRTALEVADKQADVAKAAVAAAAASAEAAREAAEAATLNARTASATAVNQGVHAVARLRQEWIDGLRSRVAEAHALLANTRPALGGQIPADACADTEHRRRANEAVTMIELMLNPAEDESKELLSALDAMNKPGLSIEERQERGAAVRAAAKAILKIEWDRVRGELRGDAT